MKHIKVWMSAFFALALTLTFIPTSAFAADVSAAEKAQESAGLLSDPDFMADATVSTRHNADGTYEFDLVRTSQQSASAARVAEVGESNLFQESVKIIAPDQEAADAIEAGLQSAIVQAVGSGTVDSSPTWFLGSSLCLQLVVTYSSHSGQINGQGVVQTFYRINSVKATASVNSGTTINSRNLTLGSMGMTETGAVNTYSHTFDITSQSNPYTSTALASQPYISGLLTGSLGATFECSAARSSGSASTYSVTCDVFVN